MLSLDKSAERHLQYLQEIEKMKLIKFRTLKSGITYWETEWRTQQGKRYRRKLPFNLKSQEAEARAFAKEIYLKQFKGDVLDECTITFREMADTYFRERNIADKGKNYRMDILFAFIGDTLLDKITFRDYEYIIKYLKQRPMKNQSVNRYLSDLSAILNLAKKKRIIKDFPPITKLDAEPRRKATALTREELDKIYAVLPDYMKDPFEMAWRTGWRKANLVGLKKKHLTKRPNGTYLVRFPAEEMKARFPFEHVCTDDETKIIERNYSLEHEYIFRRPQVNGAKTNHLGDFKKVIITARKKSGVHFTWHWLRHTYATNLTKAGVQEQTMNKLMAWSPRSRMAGNYSHLTDEDFLADVREKVEKLGHVMDTQKDIGKY